MTMQLPTDMQTRQERTPLDARVLLAGMPKSGKTTLLSQWAPKETLIIDTQKGTTMLEDEHFVQHVTTWSEFEQTVDLVVSGDHPFKTIGIDLIDDVWNFVDVACAGRGASLATATDDYGRAAKNAEGQFRRTIGKLLSTDLGIWFVTHTKPVEVDKVTRYVPRLDGKVLTYVTGACEVILLAETLGPRRLLHTAPSQKFEAGSRVPLPEPMNVNARELYGAMAAGLKAPEQQPAEAKDEAKAETEAEAEATEVAAAEAETTETETAVAA